MGLEISSLLSFMAGSSQPPVCLWVEFKVSAIIRKGLKGQSYGRATGYHRPGPLLQLTTVTRAFEVNALLFTAALQVSAPTGAHTQLSWLETSPYVTLTCFAVGRFPYL